MAISRRLIYFDATVTPVACFASGRREIHTPDLRKYDIKFRMLGRAIAGLPGGFDLLARVECTRNGMHDVLECTEQAEMLGTTLENSKLHCQLSRQPLVETCPRVDERTTDKYWKTNRHMGFANTKVLPMEMFGRIGAQQLGEFPSGKQVRLDSTQLHAAQCSLANRMHV